MDQLLDSLPVAIVVIDDGRVASWNHAAELLYGRARTEVVGQPVLEVLFDESDAAEVEALFDQARAGTTWEGDFRVHGRDGAHLVSAFRLVPISDGRLAWLAIDSADQKLAEEERAVLLSAEHAARATAEDALALLEAVLTAAPVGIAVLDPDLRYLRVNDSLAAMNGIDVAGHLGRGVDEVFSAAAEVIADLRRVLTTGRTVLGREVSGSTPAQPGVPRHFIVNSYPVVDAEGRIAGAGMIVVEITDRKRAEAERIELLARAELAQHRLAVLATASSVLTSTMEVDSLLERLARVLVPAVADCCIIELINPAGDLHDVVVSHTDRMVADEIRDAIMKEPIDLTRPGPIADVVNSARARFYEGDNLTAALHATSRHPQQLALNQSLGLTGAILAPIEARGVVLGVLGLSVMGGGRELTEGDLDLAVELAHRAALAVGNARAFEQERRVAETLQRALLPSTLPSFAGIDVAVRYIAAVDGVDVGGDWYDVIPLTPECVGLVIGDVVGHDVRAASAMGQVRNAMRAFVVDGVLDPADAMQRTDRLMDRLGLSLATSVLAIIDVAARALTWSNAGHPAPLLISDREVRLLEDGRRLLLGGGWPTEAEVGTAQLRPGDTVVLYTDGLVERRGESIVDGFERLTLAARSGAALGAEELCDHLVRELLVADARQDDDVALLVARVH